MKRNFSTDVNKMLKVSSKEWFNIELTNEQIQFMLNGLGPDGKDMF